jgi:hypothetical protein
MAKLYHHHVAIKEVGHLLIHSGLTHLVVSSVVFLGSFCLLGRSFLSIWVICYVAFDLHVVSMFSCSPVFCPKLGLYLIPLQSVYLFCDLSNCIQLFFSYILSLLLLFLLQYLEKNHLTVLETIEEHLQTTINQKVMCHIATKFV